MRPSEALYGKREEVLAILARFNARRPMIFGSVARGDDADGSDLDILIEIERPSTYYDVFRIEDALSSLLGVNVDIHTVGDRSSRFAREIAKDLKELR